jgi:hypothetical protein
MAKKTKESPGKQSNKLVNEIVASLRREVRERLGSDSTFEQRRDASFEIMRDVLWKDSEDDLQGSVTNAEEVEVGGKRYRRLQQPSSATYYGRFGAHEVHEALYREVGVHNGATIKPIELRTGIVEHLTPDMARIVGALSGERSSRSLERTLHPEGSPHKSRNGRSGKRA